MHYSTDHAVLLAIYNIGSYPILGQRGPPATHPYIYIYIYIGKVGLQVATIILLAILGGWLYASGCNRPWNSSCSRHAVVVDGSLKSFVTKRSIQLIILLGYRFLRLGLSPHLHPWLASKDPQVAG